MTEDNFDMRKAVRLSVDGGVAFLSLGGPDERVIILDEERMAGLREALNAVASRNDLRGLVIHGPNERCFCAGADINIIRSVSTVTAARDLAREGQEIFQMIEDLRIPTVAAIAGSCVGGGYELALACRYRVALDAPNTKVGLPETKLGIVPGFGGTQRLPRLIGVPAALELILKGTVLPAQEAFAKGLVDLVVHPEQGSDDGIDEIVFLRKRAFDVVLGKTPVPRRTVSFVHRALTATSVGRALAAKRSRSQILSRTGGHYPAPLKAIDVICGGMGLPRSAGYELEANALADLIVTDVCKSLVHVHFLTESSSKLGKMLNLDVRTLHVGIVGAGTMGAGIAALHLASGIPVTIVEIDKGVRDKARNQIERSLAHNRRLGADKAKKALDLLRMRDNILALAECDVVIEAVPEAIDLKRDILSQLSEVVTPRAIIASNTSSLSLSELAESVVNPERVIGMHFFNPAEKMLLVEVIRGEQTGERAIAVTAALAVGLGKYPIIVEDVPGFFVNRVLSPYLMEAVHLFSQGYSVESIDGAALRFGMPMGPLRLLDEIGLDVAAKVAEVVANAYGDRLEGPRFAEMLASRGRFGRKSGRGFYAYEDGHEHPDPEVRIILGISAHIDNPKPEYLAERLILSMLNEAVRVLDEGVAGAPGKEAAGQIDLGTVMGIGFAPFRGGILNYGSSIGAQSLVERFMAMESECGPRYHPTPGIAARAALGLSFREPVPNMG